MYTTKKSMHNRRIMGIYSKKNKWIERFVPVARADEIIYNKGR